MHVKKGDNIIVIAGKDKGKSGKILRALPKEDKVLVEGVNVKKVHERAQKKGAKGTVVEKNFPIHVSNVRLAESAPKKAKSSKLAAKS